MGLLPIPQAVRHEATLIYNVTIKHPNGGLVTIRKKPEVAINDYIASLRTGDKVQGTLIETADGLWCQISLGQYAGYYFAIAYKGKTFATYSPVDSVPPPAYEGMRLRHDHEIAGMDRQPTSNAYTPETVPLFERMQNGSKGTANLSSAWQNFVKAIQPTDDAWRAVQVQRNGWVNLPQVFPRVQTLGFGGGRIRGERVGRGWVRVETFKLSDQPPVLPTNANEKIAFIEESPFIHRFVNVNRTDETKLIDLRPGGVYVILISAAGYLYVPEYRVIGGVV